ncbi:MAG: methyltransferase domain-containing protein [Chloroflexi bacterium]|nr:methyltransferase domain-containing protein [Chloroflexota bacterium]
MCTLVERYDHDAEDYETWWAPVLDASARGLLDRVGAPIASHPSTRPIVADVGTGSGVLAIDAAARWPDALVLGVDPSRGMLGMAARRAERAALDDDRVRWITAPAAAMPIPDASVDLVVSSFALQLVPDRPAALAEARRVLRPGGQLAFITWLDRGEPFPPAEEFDEAVLDLGVEEPEPAEDEAPVAGDLRSVRSAADEVRRAGFVRVSARETTLAFDWTLASYLAFKIRYDETALFRWLSDEDAHRLVDIAQRRLSALPPEAFHWRTPLVSVVARRPA